MQTKYLLFFFIALLALLGLSHFANLHLPFLNYSFCCSGLFRNFSISITLIHTTHKHNFIFLSFSLSRTRTYVHTFTHTHTHTHTNAHTLLSSFLFRSLSHTHIRTHKHNIFLFLVTFSISHSCILASGQDKKAFSRMFSEWSDRDLKKKLDVVHKKAYRNRLFTIITRENALN